MQCGLLYPLLVKQVVWARPTNNGPMGSTISLGLGH